MTVTLGGLVRDDLLTMRGNVAVVTTLCPREQDRLNELRRIAALDLADRSHGPIPAVELDRLEALIGTVNPDRVGLVRSDIWGQTMCEFMTRVNTPVARTSECRLMTELIDATYRYQLLGWAAIINESGADSTHTLTALRQRQITKHYDQIDSYRTGNRRAILAVAARREDYTDFIGQSSLTRENVDATRVPVRRKSLHLVPVPDEGSTRDWADRRANHLVLDGALELDSAGP